MSPEPFVSRAKALPAKRNEKGYGDENVIKSVADFGTRSNRPKSAERALETK